MRLTLKSDRSCVVAGRATRRLKPVMIRTRTLRSYEGLSEGLVQPPRLLHSMDSNRWFYYENNGRFVRGLPRTQVLSLFSKRAIRSQSTSVTTVEIMIDSDWYGSTSGDLSALRLLQAASEAAAANPLLRMLYQIQHNLRFCPNAPVISAMLLVRSQWRTFLCLRLVPTEKWRLCGGYKCGDSVWRLHEWRLCGGYKIMYQYRSLSVNRPCAQL